MNKTAIHTTDTIHATVTSPAGNMIITMTMSGYSSLTDLLQSICRRLTGVAGLVRVELRNSTLGWLERRSLRLGGKPAVSRGPVQLSLF